MAGRSKEFVAVWKRMEPPLRGWRLSSVRLRQAGPFLLILSAVLVVSCGGGAAFRPAARATRTPAVTSRPPSGTPKQRAVADARAILGEFVPPPGAVRLAGQPKLPSGSGTMTLNSITLVDAVGYWRVSGEPAALLAWEKAHISRGFSR